MRHAWALWAIITLTLPNDLLAYYLEELCKACRCEGTVIERSQQAADCVVTILSWGRYHSTADANLTVTVQE